jgi:hypothetical protein
VNDDNNEVVNDENNEDIEPIGEPSADPAEVSVISEPATPQTSGDQ